MASAALSSDLVSFSQAVPGCYKDIPNYDLIAKIGTGATGEVFSAIPHPSLDLKKIAVAVKIIRLEVRQIGIKEEAIVRGLVNTAGRIVNFYDGFDYLGSRCLVYELMSMDLFEFRRTNLKVKNEVNLLKIVTILKQVSEGLKVLSENHVVHLDLKTTNVLVKIDSKEQLSVCLADFGSACNLKKRLPELSDEHTTHSYRAPEIMAAFDPSLPPLEKSIKFFRKVVGPLVDIWALGFIALELLTENFFIYNDLDQCPDLMPVPIKLQIEKFSKLSAQEQVKDLSMVDKIKWFKYAYEKTQKQCNLLMTIARRIGKIPESLFSGRMVELSLKYLEKVNHDPKAPDSIESAIMMSKYPKNELHKFLEDFIFKTLRVDPEERLYNPLAHDLFKCIDLGDAIEDPVVAASASASVVEDPFIVG